MWVDLENTMLSERSQTQNATLYDSICMECPEETNPQRQKVDEWLTGLGVTGR